METLIYDIAKDHDDDEHFHWTFSKTHGGNICMFKEEAFACFCPL